MGERTRCPHCGGLVAVDAEWCGQCFRRLAETPAAPLREPAPAPPGAEQPSQAPGTPPRDLGTEPPTSAGDRGLPTGFHTREGGRLVWVCPACDGENELDAGSCVRCGTPFRDLLGEGSSDPEISAGRAGALSLAFPGLGHWAAGKGAEGVARGVVFGWLLSMVVAIVFVRRGLELGPFLPLVVILLACAALVYVLTAVDAQRLAERRRQVVSTRMLLYGTSALMVLTVGMLMVSAIGALRDPAG